MSDQYIIERLAWKTCGILAFVTLLFGSAVVALLILLIPLNLSIKYSEKRHTNVKESDFKIDN